MTLVEKKNKNYKMIYEFKLRNHKISNNLLFFEYLFKSYRIL